MKLYEARPGVCVDVIATDMVKLAIESSENVVVIFNDIRLLAKPPTQAKEIVDSYWEASGRDRPLLCNLIPIRSSHEIN